MSLRENAPDLMEVYAQEALASRCELAVLRSRRLGKVEESDRGSLDVLRKLLESALAGNATVSSTQLAATSEESIEVFQKTLRAIVDQTPVGEEITKRLEILRDAATSLVNGKLPPGESINALQSFLHRYRLIQRELIRYPQRSQGTGASLWNLAMRMNSL